MRPLSDAAVLGVWEVGRAQSPPDRALTMLQAAEPEAERGELAALSVGQRDALLLEAYRRTFGSRLRGLAECPACQAPLEVELDAERLRPLTGSAPSGGEQVLRSGPYTLRFRLPDSRDLTAAAAAASPAAGRQLLARACITEARCNGEDVRAELPELLLGELAGRLADLDPDADVRLELDCPECGHRWQLTFDAAEYLWAEISARARRVLYEVDALARAYGWSEAEILSLSPARRASYLELAF